MNGLVVRKTPERQQDQSGENGEDCDAADVLHPLAYIEAEDRRKRDAGNGTTNFGLPNLQGNVPMDWGTSVTGTSYVIGEMGGSPSVTLLANQIPSHSHLVQVSQATTGSTNIPSPSVWLGDAGPGKIYATTGVLNTPLSGNAIGPTGGGQPHENRQPFLTVNFCIATSGAFPPRS